MGPLALWEGYPASHDEAMEKVGPATLHIELEDVGGTSWCAGVIATIASQSGKAYLRFVGIVNGERKYEGSTFLSPCPFGTFPAKENWTAGVRRSLEQLLRDLEGDGWSRVGKGGEPWAYQFRRTAHNGFYGARRDVRNVGMRNQEISVELSAAESLTLLRQAVVGRLAVVVDGRPDIFPVNHLVDHGSVVFRTAEGTKLAGAAGHPVAFEVDGYDDEKAVAWSVVVKGNARVVIRMYDALEVVRLPLFPWHSAPKPYFIRIEAETISGRRFQVTGGVPPAAPSDPIRHAAEE